MDGYRRVVSTVGYTSISAWRNWANLDSGERPPPVYQPGRNYVLASGGPPRGKARLKFI